MLRDERLAAAGGAAVGGLGGGFEDELLDRLQRHLHRAAVR